MYVCMVCDVWWYVCGVYVCGGVCVVVCVVCMCVVVVCVVVCGWCVCVVSRTGVRLKRHELCSDLRPAIRSQFHTLYEPMINWVVCGVYVCGGVWCVCMWWWCGVYVWV